MDWISDRQVYLWGRLAEVRPKFSFFTPTGGTNTNSAITLTGLAPVEMKGIKLNGNIATNLTWTSVTNWSITATQALGWNSFEIIGYERKTNTLPLRDLGYTTNASNYYELPH